MWGAYRPSASVSDSVRACGEERPVSGGEPDLLAVQLPFEHRGLVTEDGDLDVLVAVTHRQEPQQRQRVGHAEGASRNSTAGHPHTVTPSDQSAHQNRSPGLRRGSTFRMRETRPGRVPPQPRGDGAHTAGKMTPAAAAASQRPALHPTATTHLRGSLCRGFLRGSLAFTRPVFPSPVTTGWNGSPWA
jgi:hypothetical protein